MEEYTIEITGTGPLKDIIEELGKVSQALESGEHLNSLGVPLHSAVLEDKTLLTKIEEI